MKTYYAQHLENKYGEIVGAVAATTIQALSTRVQHQHKRWGDRGVGSYFTVRAESLLDAYGVANRTKRCQ